MKYWGGVGAFWGGSGDYFSDRVVLHTRTRTDSCRRPNRSVDCSWPRSAVVLGGVSAIGAGLVSIGIPKDSVLKYDVALKTDKYVLVVHGTPDEVEKAKDIIAGTEQSHYVGLRPGRSRLRSSLTALRLCRAPNVSYGACSFAARHVKTRRDNSSKEYIQKERQC